MRRLDRARDLSRDVGFLIPRRPRLAVALAAAQVSDSTDPMLLPALEVALGIRKTPGLLRRRALVLEKLGELTAALHDWEDLSLVDADSAVRERLLRGRIIELDLSWLPTNHHAPEPIQPANTRRVLHIVKQAIPERWSGYTIRTLNSVRAQLEAGLEPIVATDVVTGRDPRLPAAYTHAGIEHVRLARAPDYDAHAVPNDLQLLDAVEALVPIVREVRPAILHAHSGHRGGEYALVALALRERFGLPVVYEVRGLFEAVWTKDLERAERSELFSMRVAQETRIANAADHVIAISEALREELVSRGVPRERISVVPNGIEPTELVPVHRDARLTKRLGLDGRFVVGYLGNLDHWREGIDVLIEALSVLRRRGRTDIAVLVVGDGKRRSELEAEARRFGVSEQCRFTGRVPHDSVNRYYAQMDLFVTPRVDERAARYITPVKPFEAMALGLPLLVSDLPALREIVDPPNRGRVAPAGEAMGLATAIQTLSDDPAVRARIAAAGRQWVLAERTWASNGPRYRSVYDSVLGPRKARVGIRTP